MTGKLYTVKTMLKDDKEQQWTHQQQDKDSIKFKLRKGQGFEFDPVRMDKQAYMCMHTGTRAHTN